MTKRTLKKTPDGSRTHVRLVTPLSTMRSTSPAEQDDGDDSEDAMKDSESSIQQRRASKDATVETVDKLADLLSDSGEHEKKFQKDRLPVINRETYIAHKSNSDATSRIKAEGI